MTAANGIPATILRPACFIQNDFGQKTALTEQGVYAMPNGDLGVSLVDVRDIGEAAAKELLRRERASTPLPRETYALVGPDALKAQDFVELERGSRPPDRLRRRRPRRPRADAPQLQPGMAKPTT